MSADEQKMILKSSAPQRVLARLKGRVFFAD